MTRARPRRDIAGLPERVVARTPAGRWGTPDNFAGNGGLAREPASEFVTGAAIPLDGGFSVQG